MERTSARLLALLAALLLPLPAMAATGGTPNGKPFIEIQGQIIEVQADVSSLEMRFQSLLERVTSLDLDLQGQIDALKEEIIKLETIDAELQASLSQAVADIESQGNDIQGLLSALSQVNVQLVDLMNSTDGNSASIEALEADKAAILADIASLDGALVTAISEISENRALISKVEDEVTILASSKQDDITGVCPPNTSISTVNDDGSLMCGTTNASGDVLTWWVLSPPVSLVNTVVETFECVRVLLGLCLEYGIVTTYTYDTASIFVPCPEGYKISGGGHILAAKTASPDFDVISSHPDTVVGGEGWALAFRNRIRGNQVTKLLGEAVCLKAQ
jgi:hypothetical protein